MRKIVDYEYMANKSNDYRLNIEKFVQNELDNLFESVSNYEYLYSKEISRIWFLVNSLEIDGKELTLSIKNLKEKVTNQ